MGNPGVYGKRRKERLDYAAGVSESELETTAVDTANINDSAVTSAKVASNLKTDQILVQATPDNVKQFVPKPPKEITLSNIKMLASLGTATTGSAGTLTVDLLKASAGYGTTTNLATLAVTGTTGNLKVDGSSALSETVATTQALIASFGATTLVDDGAGVFVSYTH